MFIYYLDIESFISSKFFLYYNFQSDFSIFYFFDFILVFSYSLDHLVFLKNMLYGFFSSRYFQISAGFVESFSIHKRIDILSWSFFYSDKNRVLSTLSLPFVRLQKFKLKTLIKTHSNLRVCSLINVINCFIFDWSRNYSSSDFFWDVASELDVYLQKILWRWARRRHPRRTNTWIYGRYWRKFIGGWRFFSVDRTTGNVVFLRSHSISNTRLFHLPVSLNYFDLLNTFKFRKVYNKKSFKFFNGVCKLLWKRQNGLCFVCKRSFVNISFLSIKVRYVNKDLGKLSNLVILHSSCFIGLCVYLNFYFCFIYFLC